jgi:putative tryptophan/tyrosine transport system substrate-binding protein
MRRRTLTLTALGAVLLRPADGMSQARVRTIGVLDAGDPGSMLAELRAGLSALGHVEGKTYRLEIRSGANVPTALRRHADDLVRLKVDVLLVRLTPPLRAAMAATSSIPIVMAAVGSPVESGLIASLGRPGGNVTGMSLGGIQLAGKRLQLMRQLVPGLRRLTLVAIAADAYADLYMSGAAQVGRELGLEVTETKLADVHELPAAIAAIERERPDAIHTMANLPLDAVLQLSLNGRVPLFPTQRNAVEVGGLMSYGGRLEEQYRGAATYIDKILKGADPASLAVEEPSRYELVINMRSVKALGLSVPGLLLAQADEIIE